MLTLWKILQPERDIRVWQRPLEQDGEDGDCRCEEAKAAHHFCEHSGCDLRGLRGRRLETIQLAT